jgi:hypothetical protein
MTGEETTVIYFKYYDGVEGLRKIAKISVWKVDVPVESRFESGTSRI